MSELEILERYRQIGCGIIYQAVLEFRALGKFANQDRHSKMMREAFEEARYRGYFNPADEVISFFYSEWCRSLCLVVGIDYGAMLGRLGLPRWEEV